MLFIIRPHHGLLLPTEYSGLSVCHTSEPAKTAELIEMPFGLRTPVDTRIYVLNGGPDPLMGMVNFEGERGVPL